MDRTHVSVGANVLLGYVLDFYVKYKRKPETGDYMNITVYLGANPGKDEKYKKGVWELGTWIAAAGHRLIYGGSAVGLMGVLADAVLAGGGEVIGVEPDFFLAGGGEVIGVEPGFFVRDALQHEGITQLIVTETMQERKKIMLEMGDVYIAFPGGTGTLEEIAEAISQTKLGLSDKKSILFNLDGYYDPLIEMIERMTEEEFLFREERRGLFFARTVEEIADIIS